MLSPRSGKAKANESKYPYIVELAVKDDKLDVELGRRIMVFHQSRDILPRHGRTLARQDGYYYRWCFSDLSTARAFVEQFGGEFCKPSTQ